MVTFGSDPATFSSATPANFSFTTTYSQLFANPIYDGYFAFINAVPDMGVYWHTGAIDHTPSDIGGYMFLLNPGSKPGQFYTETINNLCIGERYEFSAYLTNIAKPLGQAKPNVLFQIRTPSDNTLIGQLGTGDIPEYSSMAWAKYGISFVAMNTSVVLIMISNTANWAGNDMAIDDIAFRICSNASSAACATG